MNEQEERMKNLEWFADIRNVLYGAACPIDKIDEYVEEIYNITKEKFKQ